MTPKEKAEELLERMTVHHWTDVCDSEGAKQCALIAVDEILDLFLEESRNTRYWEDVKEELEKISTL